MIEYSVRSRRAVARLFSPYNDIDIYVEDRSYVGVYEKLLNRALNGRAKITRVIPLGPKSEVIKAASEDIDPKGRPRLYIVDGDLDLIAYKRQVSYSHLYRLNVYSLENLLMDTKALAKYCAFAAPSMADGVCDKAVDPPQLLADLDQLRPYIVLMAIARRLKIRNATFSFNPPSVTKTVRGRHIGPDKSKVYSKTRLMVRTIISQVGLVKFKAAKQAVVDNIERRNLADHRIVPAKVFGMMYFNERVVAAGGASMPQKIVVSYLADHADLNLDKRFLSRLRKLSRTRP